MSFKLLIPFGVFTYAWFLLAILTGLRVIKTNIKIHKTSALIGIILATLHAVTMIYLTFF